LRGAMAPFAAIADKKGISLTLDLVGLSGPYQGDPTRVRQIACNLVSNAVKFTDQGGVSMRVSPHGAGVLLVVVDTGVGMTEAGVKGLFSEFGQAEASTARHFGGTGLGLSICRHLASLMGGTITVDSAMGEGSTFSVSIPLARLDPSEDPEFLAVKPRDDQNEAAPRLRVLAAEDNAVNRMVLETLLRQFGVEVTMVENGRLAVETWAAADWDVILMDVRMPEMDGPAAAREIRLREADSGRGRTPIIALTADTMAHQIAEHRAAGMDAHVGKPILAKDLYEALMLVVDGAEGHAAKSA
jgi:CheY-like chemotaxis protein